MARLVTLICQIKEEDMDQDWLQVTIFTSTEGLDILGDALTENGYSSFSIIDATDYENLCEGKYGAWDYIMDDLTQLKDAKPGVSIYLPNDRHGRKDLEAIEDMLSSLRAGDIDGELGCLEYTISYVKDESWETSWQSRFEAIPVGEKLVVCPPWVNHAADGRTVLRIEPGMASGTGNDITTRMCLEAVENAVKVGDAVLDIGCGSGILAIGALLLGAGSAVGLDIDPIAVKSAHENASLNGVSDRVVFLCGSLADSVAGEFDVICINIAADTILTLLPVIRRFLKPDGILILSGIAKNREQDVAGALADLGLSAHDRLEVDGWVCMS